MFIHVIMVMMHMIVRYKYKTIHVCQSESRSALLYTRNLNSIDDIDVKIEKRCKNVHAHFCYKYIVHNLCVSCAGSSDNWYGRCSKRLSRVSGSNPCRSTFFPLHFSDPVTLVLLSKLNFQGEIRKILMNMLF